jgi:hypothetical protein
MAKRQTVGKECATCRCSSLAWSCKGE